MPAPGRRRARDAKWARSMFDRANSAADNLFFRTGHRHHGANFRTPVARPSAPGNGRRWPYSQKEAEPADEPHPAGPVLTKGRCSRRC
jgi:hypothetical protein